MTEVLATDTSTELPSLTSWNPDQLPLVTLTVGDGLNDFEALYDHLEAISQEPRPKQQSLIVARPEMPEMLYKVLRGRTKAMAHVHIRRLADDVEDCAAVRHETGTFYVTIKRPQHRS